MVNKIFFKNNFYKIFFIFLIFFAYYRSPYIFNNGRFFSLDLTYYFIALDLNFFDAITYIDYSARYINLISNISALISSKLFELDNAQFVSVYLSLLIYSIIFYLILFKESYLFKRKYQKFLGALIALIAPVMSFEIWLNAINLQVYLGILTFVILFLKDENKNVLFYFILIGISSLSGIYACILMPLFFLKLINKRNYFNLIYFLTIFFCTLIQLFIIYNSTKVMPLGEGNTALSLSKFANISFAHKFESISFAYNVIIRSFFGSSFPVYLASFFNMDLPTVFVNENVRNFLFLFSVLIIILSLIFFIIAAVSIKNYGEKLTYIFLIFLFFFSSFVIILGGVSMSVQGRYAAFTGIILIFSFLHLSNVSSFNLIKKLSITLVIFTIISGIYDYRYKKYVVYLDCISCPDWSEEVRKYKSDKNYKLRAWPYHIDR